MILHFLETLGRRAGRQAGMRPRNAAVNRRPARKTRDRCVLVAKESRLTMSPDQVPLIIGFSGYEDSCSKRRQLFPLHTMGTLARLLRSPGAAASLSSSPRSLARWPRGDSGPDGRSGVAAAPGPEAEGSPRSSAAWHARTQTPLGPLCRRGNRGSQRSRLGPRAFPGSVSDPGPLNPARCCSGPAAQDADPWLGLRLPRVPGSSSVFGHVRHTVAAVFLLTCPYFPIRFTLNSAWDSSA